MEGVPIWEPKEITEAPGMDFSPVPKFSPGNPLLNKVEQSDRIAGTWRSRNRIRSKSAMRNTNPIRCNCQSVGFFGHVHSVCAFPPAALGRILQVRPLAGFTVSPEAPWRPSTPGT